MKISPGLILMLLLPCWAGAQTSQNPQEPKVTVSESPAPNQTQVSKDTNRPQPESEGLKLLAVATGIATMVGGFSAFLGLRHYKHQAVAATRDHLNNVHQSIFERLDKADVREARHYVYALDRKPDNEGKIVDGAPLELDKLTFQKEHWLLLGSKDCPGSPEEQKRWGANKGKAELIARALDQLGYLVREGIVPLNVVARFYSYPTLRCWYQLSPYIAAVRLDRKQHGHMWEWENLVKKIIKGAISDCGLWKGTGEHDNLNDYAAKIKERTADEAKFPWDRKWLPPDLSWEWTPKDHSKGTN
jgi:hypothetical protein